MWKKVLLIFGLLLAFAVMVIAFGYLDDELDPTRRIAGCVLIAVGIAIAIPAMARLREDWPRLKPVHNVDLAFVQIMVAAGVLWFAWAMGGRAPAFIEPLINPVPKTFEPPPDPAD